jgi:hypothetical protein
MPVFTPRANTAGAGVVSPYVKNSTSHAIHNRSGGPFRALLLSEQEAMALLEVCLLSPASDDPLRAALFGKVAQVCREFVSDPASTSAPGGIAD